MWSGFLPSVTNVCMCPGVGKITLALTQNSTAQHLECLGSVFALDQQTQLARFVTLLLTATGMGIAIWRTTEMGIATRGIEATPYATGCFFKLFTDRR